MPPKLKEQNGKYYQQCQVIILATDDFSAPINLLPQTNRLGFFKEEFAKVTAKILNLKPQHLYILSDEKIKEGDQYVIKQDYKKGYQVATNPATLEEVELQTKFDCKKIIATTNNSLKLPQPSQSFIKKYIQEYSTDNVIEDVLVEYENVLQWNRNTDRNVPTKSDLDDIYRVRINLDNTVTITKLKDSYSREELDIILDEVLNLGMTIRQDQLNGIGPMSGKTLLEIWKKDNL